MKAKQGKRLFHGVHVKDEKSLACTAAIERLQPPDSVEIALSQSIGRPAIPVVTAGERVARGQLIAKRDGAVSSNLFASVCGTVKRVDSAIVIETDGTESVSLPVLHDPSIAEIRDRAKEAGIVGLGGAAFPTAVKLEPPEDVDILLLNGAECEPYLTCDDRLMQEKTDQIVKGARYLARAVKAEQILIGIEANKPKAIAAFEPYPDIQPVILQKQYPMGSEKHLIYACTGRKVPLGKLPSAVGVNVQNVATAFALYEAIELGKPLYERVVTVSGRGVTTPKNLLVPVGTSVRVLLEACGYRDCVKVILGGPMTGTALFDLDTPVKKSTGGVLALTAAETDVMAPTPCISCGKCASVCPMRLMPMLTEFYTEAREYDLADKKGGVLSCIECGACAYICPARRPLLQSIRSAKAELRKQGGRA